MKEQRTETMRGGGQVRNVAGRNENKLKIKCQKLFLKKYVNKKTLRREKVFKQQDAPAEQQACVELRTPFLCKVLSLAASAFSG